MKQIEKIIDACLKQTSENKILMMTPSPVPEKMLNRSIEAMDDWRGWKPMDSIITDEDIAQLEKKIGYGLPKSFCHYLKYKHFFRLSLPDRAVNLAKHLPDKDLSLIKEMIFDTHEPELLIEKGLIYFADFEDFGLLCFDAREKRENNEYKLVFIDHEDLEDIHEYADSFQDLLEGDEERGERFIDYLNELYVE